jgi:hypothetical protein
MKETTFGSFPAAKILAGLLDKNKKAAHKISSITNDFESTLAELKAIKTRRIRKKIMLLWLDKTRSNVEQLNIPDEIKKFTLNVISTIFKKQYKGATL